MAEGNAESERSLKNRELITLFSIYSSESGKHLDVIHAEQKFYSTIVLAVLGAPLLISGRSDSFLYQSVALIMAGSVAYCMTLLSHEGLRRGVRAWIEVISTKVKLESELGLYSLHAKIWPEEGLIAARHIQNQEKSDSSEKFVRNGVKNSVTISLARHYSFVFIVAAVTEFAIGAMSLIWYQG